MRIGFDLDGVVADFVPEFLKILNRLYGNGWTIDQLRNKSSYYFCECLPGLTHDMEWDAFEHLGEWFWLMLKPFDVNMMKVLALLAEKHNIYFVTNRAPNPTDELTLWQSRRWLEQFGIKPAGVILTKDKGQACKLLKLEMFIDDYAKNVYEITKHSDTKCYLIDKPHNRDYKTDLRVGTVFEYINKIRGK